MSNSELDAKLSVLLELLSDIETRISKLELEVKHGELSRFRPIQPASSVSLADIGRVPESELSEDTRDKLKKTADLILQYCKEVPYLRT
jgi:hypothetical protein